MAGSSSSIAVTPITKFGGAFDVRVSSFAECEAHAAGFLEKPRKVFRKSREREMKIAVVKIRIVTIAEEKFRN
jgi:hypothetical protein